MKSLSLSDMAGRSLHLEGPRGPIESLEGHCQAVRARGLTPSLTRTPSYPRPLLDNPSQMEMWGGEGGRRREGRRLNRLEGSVCTDNSCLSPSWQSFSLMTSMMFISNICKEEMKIPACWIFVCMTLINIWINIWNINICVLKLWLDVRSISIKKTLTIVLNVDIW